MKISEVIELCKSEMDENGDSELNIYDSDGNRIEPTGFMYGGRITSRG